MSVLVRCSVFAFLLLLIACGGERRSGQITEPEPEPKFLYACDDFDQSLVSNVASLYPQIIVEPGNADGYYKVKLTFFDDQQGLDAVGGPSFLGVRLACDDRLVVEMAGEEFFLDERYDESFGYHYKVDLLTDGDDDLEMFFQRHAGLGFSHKFSLSEFLVFDPVASYYHRDDQIDFVWSVVPELEAVVANFEGECIINGGLLRFFTNYKEYFSVTEIYEDISSKAYTGHDFLLVDDGDLGTVFDVILDPIGLGDELSFCRVNAMFEGEIEGKLTGPFIDSQVKLYKQKHIYFKADKKG